MLTYADVCRWNDRGFGFIKPQDGGEELFCHFSVITDGNCLREGDLVEYESEYNEGKAKYQAINPPPTRPPHQKKK